MPIADSGPSILFILFVCLCASSTANETWIENATQSGGQPEMEGESRMSTESRILDGTQSALNLTSFLTIDSKYQVEEQDPELSSTTLRCPSSSENTDFKPSVHIGEINEYESRKSDNLSKNPFNRASLNNHIKFDDTVSPDESGVDNDAVRVPTSSFRDAVSIGGSHKIPVKFFETDGRYSFVVPVDLVPHHQQQQPQYHEPQYLQIPGHPHQQDDPVDQLDPEQDGYGGHEPASHRPEPQTHQHPVVTFEYPTRFPPGYGTPGAHMTLRPAPSYHQPPQQQQQYSIPVDNLSSVLQKPTKLYDNAVTPLSPNVRYQTYQYGPIGSGEAIEKPEQFPSPQHPLPANYPTPTNYLPVENNNDQMMFTHDDQSHHMAKPDTLYYVTSHRESAVTRMRKFPYKFYDPSVMGQHDDQFHYSLQQLQPNYPSKERRVSPWKKIIHLIGAFLPLGLLLAALKPNVVRIENTTQPNIVLSKLRVIDLPAEHKRGRLVEKVGQDEECDDRSICELIVSGSQPSSNLLQNILWNFTNRSTEEEAQKHGLEEIFSAAKKKDCSLIDC